MAIEGIQGAAASSRQQQQQPDLQPSGPKSAVAREAEVAASASLQVYQQQSREQSGPVADTVQLTSRSTLKNLDAVKAIEQMHARLNELVKGVRQTNEELNKSVEQVAEMQGRLMAIVKNYPPYPIDSMQRRDLLMSYMSLRKEIENLMIPPPPAPVYEKVRSMWEAMFSQNGQMQASAVPALEASSSDKQVQDTADILGRTMQKLSTLSDSVTQGLLQA